jgi:hypothetical protein
MTRTLDEISSDIDYMEDQIARMRRARFGKWYFRCLYDEALSRVRVDLGPCVPTIELLTPDAEPEDMIKGIRAVIGTMGEGRDVPQTLLPESF